MPHNHVCSKMSELDLLLAKPVPPGGNWKNIPKNVPSKRIKQIRESYIAGKGSRSTYYGRLDPAMPSYTINTYFNRPGNGCHLHYDCKEDQHRTLSLREAARLQSFPDDFIFEGSFTSILKQIGNAVPPFMAYILAKSFNTRGHYIDLFSGAGGLSLGFKWAGWKPVIANDIDATFLKTYKRNIHSSIVIGDIREKYVKDEIKKSVKNVSRNVPLIIIGGPPCQGFSTAGNSRSMDDQRNHLFKEYVKVCKSLSVDGFLFENVSGLMNMDKGAVFKDVREHLSRACSDLVVQKVCSEEYGIPQRRTRIILAGLSDDLDFNMIDSICSNTDPAKGRFVSVREAISDLPKLHHGEDGSGKPYNKNKLSDYQKLMRGEISPHSYYRYLLRG